MKRQSVATFVAFAGMSMVPCLAADDQTGDEDNVITVYSIQCYEGELVGDECVGGFWLTNNVMKYRVLVEQQVVVTWFPAFPGFPPNKHTDCAVASIDHWTCRYSDGSGEFGFRNGEYYSEGANRTPEERERDRKSWGELVVDKERWLEVRDHSDEAIQEHQRMQRRD